MPSPTGINDRRTRRQKSLPTAALLCAVVLSLGLSLAGCGSSNESFESGEADRALSALDSIETLVDEGRCLAAERRVQVLIKQASNVNQDRPELGAAYARSTERLQQLVARECVEIKETSPTDETTAPTGNAGPTETPEPTSTPEPPAPEPTGTVTPPPEPQDPGTDNNNPPPADSGGARPE